MFIKAKCDVNSISVLPAAINKTLKINLYTEHTLMNYVQLVRTVAWGNSELLYLIKVRHWLKDDGLYGTSENADNR